MSAPPAPRILVVIPAWNEAGVIASTIAEIRAAQPDVDLLVVDDGSGDGTAAVAEAAGALFARLPFNLGVGGAMRAGYRYALREGYDVVVQIDADGQHDPQYLSELVGGLDSADVVVGARFAGAGTYRASGPRRWAMWLLARVLSRLAGVRLTDVTSGFRAANRRAVTVFADHYPAEYLGDTVESLVIALRVGCSVRQLPVEMRPRTVGQASQSPIKATIYLARAVVALGLALVRRWPSATETLGQEKS
jgi:glycosyltransferase involved in cell wall biosynthesis